MNYILLSGAKDDIRESFKFYNEEQPGLGLSFSRNVRSAIEKITEFPQAWPKLGRKFRKCQVERFPFIIVYAIQESQIVVIAVAHQKRRPGYWKNRL